MNEEDQNSLWNRLFAPFEAILTSDAAIFLKKFLQNPGEIGSVIPSSAHLAEAMTEQLSKLPPGDRCILEVGAGTGAITKHLIQQLTEGDTLDIVELAPEFCEILAQKYSDHPNVRIHCCSILEWSPEKPYDTIISSLPLNALDHLLVSEILEKFLEIGAPGCAISYYEYAALPALKSLFSKENNREAIIQFIEDHGDTSSIIWANLPPARVHHCQIKSF